MPRQRARPRSSGSGLIVKGRAERALVAPHGAERVARGGGFLSGRDRFVSTDARRVLMRGFFNVSYTFLKARKANTGKAFRAMTRTFLRFHRTFLRSIGHFCGGIHKAEAGVIHTLSGHLTDDVRIGTIGHLFVAVRITARVSE
jgi:hypothetical protein